MTGAQWPPRTAGIGDRLGVRLHPQASIAADNSGALHEIPVLAEADSASGPADPIDKIHHEQTALAGRRLQRGPSFVVAFHPTSETTCDAANRVAAMHEHPADKENVPPESVVQRRDHSVAVSLLLEFSVACWHQMPCFVSS